MTLLTDRNLLQLYDIFLIHKVIDTWEFRGGSRITRRRGRQPSRGRQHMILPNFAKKLHEIEKILAVGVGRPPISVTGVVSVWRGLSNLGREGKNSPRIEIFLYLTWVTGEISLVTKRRPPLSIINIHYTEWLNPFVILDYISCPSLSCLCTTSCHLMTIFTPYR